MKVRSLLGKALAFGLALTVAAGCLAGTNEGTGAGAASGGDDTAGTSKQLELWTINLKKNYGDYVQGLIDGFEQRHPGTEITWVDVPGADVRPKLLSAIAARKAPDVVNLTNVDLQQFIPSLHDLGPYVSQQEQDRYIDALIDPLRYDGKLVALPWYNGGAPVTVYNTELVEKAGLDPDDPPKTFTQALRWATEIHRSDPKVYGMNGIPDINVLQMEGVSFLSEDQQRPAFDTPKTLAILKEWKGAYDAGGIAPGSTVKDTRKYPQTLGNQQVAYSPGVLPSALLDVELNAPTVHEKLRVAPAATGESGRWILNDQQTFVVPKGAENPDLAADLALYLTSAKNQTAFCKLVAIYPSTRASLDDPHFRTFDEGELQDQARRIIADELPKLRLGTLGTGVDDELLESWRENVRAYFAGSSTAQQAIRTAEQEWKAILAESGGN